MATDASVDDASQGSRAAGLICRRHRDDQDVAAADKRWGQVHVRSLLAIQPVRVSRGHLRV